MSLNKQNSAVICSASSSEPASSPLIRDEAESINLDSEKALAQFVQPERFAKFQQVAAARTKTFTLVLENIHNQHNISAVIRSADAFGLASLYFVGERPQVSTGIALGANRWLELNTFKTSAEAISSLREQGFKIVVTGPAENLTAENLSAGNSQKESVAIHDLPYQEKIALVFGNEKLGVSDEFLTAADLCTYIPMFGFVESFNISVAAAICMYCSTISISSVDRKTPLLSEVEQADLRTKWLKDDIRGAELILRRLL